MFNKEQGITLVALVITVIILLILAAVAVSAITGKDGLFSKTNDAGYRYNEASLNEAEKINELIEWDESKVVEEIAPEDADLAIKTASEFIAFRDSVNAGNTYKDKKIYLIGNIDLSSIENFEPIGNATYVFEGTFDGNYHTITGAKISSNQSSNLGLFTENKGVIQNLILSNCEIINTYVGSSGGYSLTGNVAGKNSGTISQCASLDGNIMGNGTNILFRYVGGITGDNKGTIEKCYNTSTISAQTGSSNTYGQSHVGGIAGEYAAGIIKECYNMGRVEVGNGNYRMGGGIVGELSARTLSNCYNIGTITTKTGSSGGTLLLGGASGCNGTSGKAAGTITKCYFTKPTYITYNRSYSATTSPKVNSEDELKSDTVLTALGDAFERGKDGYPILTWQKNIK